MNKMKDWLPGLLLSLFITACSQGDGTRDIDTLKIAVLPDQNESHLRNKYQPLLDYLKNHVGLDSELLVPESYEQLLQWFENEQIDMALFGGVTYVKAHMQHHALPLVMRNVDGRFRSVVIVRTDNPAGKLSDLKGSSIAFGSKLSTSGHFMPRSFFQQYDIVPEVFFSKVEYSGAHDLTAEWVRDGKIDVGVASSDVIGQMFRDGRLTADTVKVIWESPPYSDYVWAVQSYISEKQIIMIRDAFLHMSHNDEDMQLLKLLGAKYYVPASHEDFRRLEQVIVQVEQGDNIQ